MTVDMKEALVKKILRQNTNLVLKIVGLKNTKQARLLGKL